MNRATSCTGEQLPSELLRLLARLYSGRRTTHHQEDRATILHEDLPPSDAAVSTLQCEAGSIAASALLDRLPFGILILDARCELRFSNASGRRMLHAADPLVHVGGRVQPRAEVDIPIFAAAAASVCTAVSLPYDDFEIELGSSSRETRTRLLALRVGATRPFIWGSSSLIQSASTGFAGC